MSLSHPADTDQSPGDVSLLSPLGAALMAEALGKIEDGSLAFTPQAEDGVTYASKITNDETRVDWTADGSAVHDHVRGLSPFPGAWFEIEIQGKRERIKVLRSEVVAVPDQGPGGTAASP